MYLKYCGMVSSNICKDDFDVSGLKADLQEFLAACCRKNGVTEVFDGDINTKVIQCICISKIHSNSV